MINVVLFEPEIPGNTGNIMRTCVATNTRLHLIKPLGFKLDEASIKRAGVNYIDKLEYFVYENYDDFLEKEKYLIKKGFSRTKEFYYKNRLVELSYSYKGLNVDFIVYRRKADVIESDTIFFMTNALGKPTRYEVYNYSLPFSELEEHNFKAVEIKVPNNAREYLSKLYGEDFEVPNTNYNWKENPIYKRVSSEEANVILL